MSVVIPSLRGAIAVPGWAKNDLWRRARAVPSLDLRFADNKSLTDAVTGASLVTFTRSGNGTYTDSAGVLQTAGTDVPRFDHNPITGESLGLLVEEQRVNSIRNNTGVGAVAGTPGTPPTNWNQSNNTGLAANVVGTGTEDGITYIDFRVNGTTTGSGQTNIVLETILGIAAATGQVWSLSSYLKIQAGSLANVSSINLVLQENTSAGAAVTAGSQAVTIPTSSLGVYRPTFTRTLSGGATVAALMPYIQININTGLVVDFTLRIGLPQLELGAFATSPILTSGAAATRNADVASIGSSAFTSFYNQSEGAMFASGDFANAGAGGFPRIIALAGANAGIDEISFYTRISIGAGDGSIFGAVTVNSSMEGDLAAPIGQPDLSGGYRSAIAYKANDFGLSSNGLAPTTDTSGTLPTITQLIIMGNVRFQNRLSGHVRRICYWPQRLANSTLQQITQ